MATNPSTTKLSKMISFRCPNELHSRMKAAGFDTNWLIEAIESKLIEQLKSEELKAEERARALEQITYPFKLSTNENILKTQKEAGLIIFEMKAATPPKTNKEIANFLNANGIPNTTGNAWNTDTLSNFYKRHLKK